MKKIFNTVLVAALMLGSTQVWAEDATVTVIASPSDGGTVMVNTTNSSTGKVYGETSTAAGEIKSTLFSKTYPTFYLFAEANEGYKFQGFNTNNSNTASGKSGVAKTPEANSTTYYAIFTGIHGEAVKDTVLEGEILETEVVVSHVHAGTIICKMKSGNDSFAVKIKAGETKSSTSEKVNTVLEVTCDATELGTYEDVVVVSGNSATCEIPVSFTIIKEIPSAVEAIDAQNRATKELRNGALIIRRGDIEYNVLGQQK